MDFYTYCEENNISLLKEDIKFFKSCLNRISAENRSKVAHIYVEIWLKAMQETDKVIAKQNVARHKANTWLRELVENDRQS
jgi:hypothetical protein